MTIIILLFVVFILITCRIVKNNTEYLSKDYTNIIKGIFIFFVFIRHFVQYKLPFENGWINNIGLKLDSRLGQLIVVMFLFYSGYGIMESIKRKGEDYVKSLPKKRILPTWINFAIAVLIYMVASQYFVTHNFSIKKIVLSVIGWDSFGNSNWYIFCILILYAITYLSFKSFRDEKKALIATFIGTVLYTVVLSFYKQTYWYNTAFCYVLGTAYSIYKEKIEEWIKDKELISIVYMIVLFIIAYRLRTNIIWYYIYSLSFALVVILITRKVKIKNAILKWMGINLFPLYIYQRLPMMLLNKMTYMRENPYIFFASAVAATIFITFIYKRFIWISKKYKNIRLKDKKI